jgi:hypothetical protein
LKELRELSRIDDDDLEEFMDLHSLGEGEEDDDDLDQEWLDPDGNNVLLNFDMIGKTFWDKSQEIRNQVRELATKLILKFVEGSLGNTHTLPIYKSKPLKDNSEMFEIDIEATIEAQIDHPGEQIQPWSYERQMARNPVVLLVDTSLSMNGEKLLIAGITVATLARLIPTKDLCVLGFAQETYFVKQFHEEISPYHLVSRIFQLVPRGSTNLTEAMRKGAEMIFPYERVSKLIMLTDAEPTSGKNPIPEAAKLPMLDLLLFPGGNAWLARKLILEVASGNLYTLERVEDVPGVIKKVFKLES